MNVLMLSLLYPNDQQQEVAQLAKDKLQNQINSYQRAFEQGLRENLLPGEQLQLFNCLPVGIYPFQYRKLLLRSGLHDGNTVYQQGCINVPWLKQHMRMHGAVHHLKRWVRSSPDNRTVLVYTQYLPYMQAIAKVKKSHPDLKAAVIVTDLPNEWGLATGRKGFLKAIEYRRGIKSLRLCQQMDGFVLLTKCMAEVLPVAQKPHEVIEGLIQTTIDEPLQEQELQPPVILYSGTLEKELGIGEMLDAFTRMPEYDLWICGRGGMEDAVKAASEQYGNIRYLGFVSQKEALFLQAQASALINPRQPEGLFTRYSFPSKTLEYMRSGKPVLCCKLEGVPRDYDMYLNYMEIGVEGICHAVKALLALPLDERQQIGQRARAFVLREKNPKAQCQKLMALLRRL